MFDQPMKIIGVTGYQAAVNRGVIVLQVAGSSGAVVSRRARSPSSTSLLEPGHRRERKSRRSRSEIEALGPVTVAPTDQLLARDRNLEVLQGGVEDDLDHRARHRAASASSTCCLMAVQERTRETGIMMAIGWSDRRIMAAIVLEGVIMGLAGCIVGVPLGFLACSFFSLLPTIGAYLTFQPSLGDRRAERGRGTAAVDSWARSTRPGGRFR